MKDTVKEIWMVEKRPKVRAALETLTNPTTVKYISIGKWSHGMSGIRMNLLNIYVLYCSLSQKILILCSVTFCKYMNPRSLQL